MKIKLKNLGALIFLIVFVSCAIHKIDKSKQFSEDLVGKPEWQNMLNYTLELHKKSTHPAEWPFDYEWEEIGPGYCYAPAFGHWDIVHQIFDALVYDEDHALKQLLNDLKNQEPSGMIPGSIWMPGGTENREKATWNKDTQGHPPVWIVAADDYISHNPNDSHLNYFYQALVRQLKWFENNRKAEGEGFFYNDILLKEWESGIDEGVRFDEPGLGAWACIDATSHVYMMYEYAEKWSKLLKLNCFHFTERKRELKSFINDSLYSVSDSMYYDVWAIKNKAMRHLVIENFWPLIAGIADKSVADCLIDRYLLDKSCFFTCHPVPSVSISDPKFELRMWRGPTWNSMTYWIARGCVKYGRIYAAKLILEKALDKTAEQYKKTGTIWEFYNPFDGDQNLLTRKPGTSCTTPCRDYLGHNPLVAMAALYETIIKNNHQK